MRSKATSLICARNWLGALTIGLVALTGSDLVARPAPPALNGRADRAQQGDPKPHKHAWVKQTRKDWVPPEKKVVQVGVDAKGKPIFETQIVKPGYWKTVTYFACTCGATRG